MLRVRDKETKTRTLPCLFCFLRFLLGLPHLHCDVHARVDDVRVFQKWWRSETCTWSETTWAELRERDITAGKLGGLRCALTYLSSPRRSDMLRSMTESLLWRLPSPRTKSVWARRTWHAARRCRRNDPPVLLGTAGTPGSVTVRG